MLRSDLRPLEGALMPNNSNSIVNVFGRISNLNQKIAAQQQSANNIDISSDISYVVKEISGKIGELSLSSENENALNQKLKELSELQGSPKNNEKTSIILDSVKKILATSANSIASKGLLAAVEFIIEKIKQ